MDRPKRLESLDGLRGVCALLIAFHHYGLVHSNVGLMFHAPLCVDVFFALSGFVVAAAYEEKLDGEMSVWRFVMRRAERLLPTHFIGTALAAAAMVYLWAKVHPSWWSPFEGLVFFFGALLLIPNPSNPTRQLFPGNPAIWSLLDEWIVNIAYAMLLRKLTLRWVVGTSIAAWFSLLGCALFLGRTYLNLGPIDGEIVPGILRAVAGFMSGVAVFRVRDSAVLKRLFSSTYPLFVFAIVPLVCIVPHLSWDLAFDLVVMMCSPLLVAVLVSTDHPTPRTFVWLGAISYPLYVSQFAPVAVASAITIGSHGIPVLALLVLCATVPLAWVVGKLADLISSRFSAPRLKPA